MENLLLLLGALFCSSIVFKEAAKILNKQKSNNQNPKQRPRHLNKRKNNNNTDNIQIIEELNKQKNYIQLLKEKIRQLKKKETNNNAENIYTQKKCFLTPTEADFYNTLQKTTFGKQNLIFANVRLADIIQHSNQTAFNKICSKHIDFVICEPTDFKILFCIELDDRSHNRKDRIKSDKFKNEALATADIPLIRIKAQMSYNHEMIQTKINNALTPASEIICEQIKKG